MTTRITNNQKHGSEARGIRPEAEECEGRIPSVRFPCDVTRQGQACTAAGLSLAALCLFAFAQDRPALAQIPPEPPDEKGQEQSLSYDGQIAFSSGHADRGFVINDRPVIQPTVSIYGRVTELSLWGSFPTARNIDGSRPHMLELELTHGQQWESFRIAPAVRWFFYHDRLSNYSTRSLEAWLYLSYDAGPFTFFSNQSVDVLTYAGAYYGEAGITSGSYVLPTVEVGGSIGAGWASSKFNESYVDIYRSAFNRLSAEGWLTVYVEQYSYVSMQMELSTIVDPDVRTETAQPTFVLVRLATGINFGGGAK